MISFEISLTCKLNAPLETVFGPLNWKALEDGYSYSEGENELMSWIITKDDQVHILATPKEIRNFNRIIDSLSFLYGIFSVNISVPPNAYMNDSICYEETFLRAKKPVSITVPTEGYTMTIGVNYKLMFLNEKPRLLIFSKILKQLEKEPA